MSGYDVALVEDTLRDWVVLATAVPRDRVTWAEQDGPRAEGKDLSLSLIMSPLRPPSSDEEMTRYHQLDYVARSWAITAGALQTPTPHELTTGDGPFVLTGAVVGSYWVVVLGPSRLGLAASFFDARASILITLPGSGSGTIASGPTTVPVDRPAERVLTGPRVLQLRVEARGGPSTGNGQGWSILEDLERSVGQYSTAVRLRASHMSLGLAGAVVRVPAVLINSGYLQPFSYWTIQVHTTSRTVERLAVVWKLEAVGLTVL